MAVPLITLTSPTNGDTGIPIGKTLEVTFDRGIDLSTAEAHVVLYGADFDLTSGPDSAVWVDKETGNNPYFLRSPGFKGLVELSYEVIYVNLATGLEVTPGTLTGEADEVAANIGHRLRCTPREQLAADTQFTWHILGDPDSQGVGISSRTVFDVVPDIGNAATTGVVLVFGGYIGSVADTVIVEITTSGDIANAKYKWYYQSAGVGSAVLGKTLSRRRRRLSDGLEIRFTGSGFIAGDIYRFNVEPAERLASNVKITFTTNDGTYTAAPTSPSTPATCEPPASVIPPAPTAMLTSALEILETTPPDGSYNNSLKTRTFTVIFSEDLDPTTITQSTVRVFKYPVSGRYDGQVEVTELQKRLTVNNDTLTIEI